LPVVLNYKRVKLTEGATADRWLVGGAAPLAAIPTARPAERDAWGRQPSGGPGRARILDGWGPARLRARSPAPAGDEELQPVATWTSDATSGTRVEEQQHAGVPLRCVHAGEGAGSFSLHPQGRPAGGRLRRASSAGSATAVTGGAHLTLHAGQAEQPPVCRLGTA